MTKLQSCALLLTAISMCAAAGAADEPKASAFKPGWKNSDFKAFTEACTDAIVKPAIEAYQDRVTASGRTDAKPFPEKELRDSVGPMCDCITRRLAESWTVQELANTALEMSKPYVEEALGGGQCKPGGLLAEMLEQGRESKPDSPTK